MAAVVAVVTAPTAAAQAMLWVSGASGSIADAWLNGWWQTHEVFNGFPSWQRVGNTELMLARLSDGQWTVASTTGIQAGKTSGSMYQADDTLYYSPTQVPAWRVWSGSAWEEQETVRVWAPLLKEEIRVRVRRGPSWDWGDQDGGPGSTGVTIPDSHAGWVGVLWDSGQAGYRYRVGAEDAYDLSVVEQVTTTPAPTTTTPAPTTTTTPATTAPPPSPSTSPSPSPLAASKCGAPSPDVCYFDVGKCISPDFDMDECREISISKSVTNTKTWSVCVGGSISASVEVNGGFATTGASVAVSSEVCHDQASDAGAEVTHVVKFPGVKGQTTVACAQGIHAVVDGKDFVSYRSGDYTVCQNACPTPTCKFAPDEIRSRGQSGAPSSVNAAQSLQSIPLASLSLALSLVGGALLA